MTTDQKVAKLKRAFERVCRDVFFQVTPAQVGSWIAIEFTEPINVDQMESVCRFIRYWFTPTEKKPYRNRMAKFSVSQGGLPAIVIDSSGQDFEEMFGSLD